jgi:hypothetical protein
VVKDTTLAYLAGMIDGDGYISITRSVRKGAEYFAPQIGISGTLRAPHDLAASTWGGSVYCYHPKNPLHRPQFQWSRQGRIAHDAIKDLFPYLLLKQEHAVLAIELYEHVFDAASEDPFPWFGPAYSPLSDMRRMREEMIALNQSRNRVGKRRSPDLLDGVQHQAFPV